MPRLTLLAFSLLRALPMRIYFISFLLTSSLFSAEQASEITLPVRTNHTIKVASLTRVAIADSKILKAKAISSSTLLLTALKAGRTMVRVWDSGGNELVYKVHVTPAQTDAVVQIALEFLELDMALGQTSGIRWPETIQFSAMSTLQGDANMTGLNYSVSFASAKGWISHLVRRGWAHVVANPELYVRLGEEAVFHSGGEFPVSTSSENYGRYHKHIEWKPYGLTAKVRPESPDHLHISSEINLEVSEVNQSASMDGIPSVTKRHLITKMNSLDGETVILSGLVRQSSRSEREGIPILSSIPLLGSLFSKSTHGSDETELLMAVTFSMKTRSQETETLERYRSKIQRPEDL